jgi:hypothetical protein
MQPRIYKTCLKCNWGEDGSDLKLGTHSGCGGAFVFWRSSNETLLDELVATRLESRSEDLQPSIAAVQRHPFGVKRNPNDHPGLKIDACLRRLSFARVLREERFAEEFQRAGCWGDGGLRLYLLSTCFDILGTQKTYLPFVDWLGFRRGTDARPSADTSLSQVAHEMSGGTLDAEAVRSICKSAHEKWAEQYGHAQSFRAFFCDLLPHRVQDVVLRHLWLWWNPTGDNWGGVSGIAQQEKWTSMPRTQKLKQIAEFICSNIRNLFSHAGHSQFDVTDIDPFGAVGPHIERGLTEGRFCLVRGEKAMEGPPAIGRRYSVAGLRFRVTVNGYVLIDGTDKYRARAAIRDFLEFRRDHRLYGMNGHLYKLDRTVALCYRDAPLTRFFEALVEEGIAAFVANAAKQTQS